MSIAQIPTLSETAPHNELVARSVSALSVSFEHVNKIVKAILNSTLVLARWGESQYETSSDVEYINPEILSLIGKIMSNKKLKSVEKSQTDDDSRNDQAETTYNFESSLTELERIVTQLESGDLPLDDALTVFEQGIQLARKGQQQLQQAEQRVQILLNDSVDAPLSPFTTDNE